MNHLDCPLCAGPATIDDEVTVVQCDGCGIRVDVAADPTPISLDAAA